MLKDLKNKKNTKKRALDLEVRSPKKKKVILYDPASIPIFPQIEDNMEDYDEDEDDDDDDEGDSDDIDDGNVEDEGEGGKSKQEKRTANVVTATIQELVSSGIYKKVKPKKP